MNNEIIDKLIEMSELLDRASIDREGEPMLYVYGYGYVSQSSCEKLIAEGKVKVVKADL